MLKEQSRFLQQLLFLGDLVIIAVSWILAYYIRFEVLDPPLWVPLSRYLVYLPVVVVLWGLVFLFSGLYRVDRAQRLHSIIYGVARRWRRSSFIGSSLSLGYTCFCLPRLLRCLW